MQCNTVYGRYYLAGWQPSKTIREIFPKPKVEEIFQQRLVYVVNYYIASQNLKVVEQCPQT